MKKLFNWIGTDGLLHFLVCYALMLTLTPSIGIIWSILATVAIAVIKEVFDYYIQKDNDRAAVLHDLILDAAGIICSVVVILI